ncbi:muconate/chloromuconate family cycloisomerase [Salibacterium aidingense]|uniref:muconate/chloromuconate family cycloisomerase n=1 Tax=Salibacterium aidingense TaxID=384933 RepID=UPI0003F7D8CB|nr:muconate/chloromuconate family cycloisomerase [Salibacterium aidingense]
MIKPTIEHITTELLDVPIKRPHQFSTTKVTSKSFVLVKVTLTNGTVGIGEGTTPGIWWNGESVETMKLVIDAYMTPLLQGGDPSEIEALMQIVDRRIRGNTFAKAAIEMALYDALGKTYHVPVHQLLGGQCQSRIPVRWALASGTREGDVDEAVKLVSSGRYTAFKTKSGKERPSEDARRNVYIAEGIKNHAALGIDPNGSWDRLTTMTWMDAFFEAGIEFLEQPLPPADIAGMAKLTAMKRVPVMADESMQSLHDALRIVQADAADIFSLKIHKSGGMKNTVKIAGIAEAAGISCFGGTSLESSIGTAAALHAYGSILNLDYGSELFGPDWLADDLVEDPLVMKDGCILVPDKPGLGVKLNEAKTAAYRRKET